MVRICSIQLSTAEHASSNSMFTHMFHFLKNTLCFNLIIESGLDSMSHGFHSFSENVADYMSDI